jgi:hypothetical protein
MSKQRLMINHSISILALLSLCSLALLRGRAAIIGCLLAPASLLAPWVVVPSKLPGVGLGGMAYFFNWAVKYPNLGFINLQVSLGIFCLVGVALVPLAFADAVRLSMPRLLKAFALVQLILLIPVWIALDWQLILTAASAELAFSLRLFLAAGPILHTVPLAVMMVYLWRHKRSVSSSA